MLEIPTRLISGLEDPTVTKAGVISWGSPVPSFGDIENSTVATLGINPSNREFVDGNGKELKGHFRRFHTLSSLGLNSWNEVDASHLSLIIDTCRNYFLGNPYDIWFKRLDDLISVTGTSYYGRSEKACHLDLIPYATRDKWTSLSSVERATLFTHAGDTLGVLLRSSPIRLLILNGSTVISQFEYVTGITLDRIEMPNWSLPRKESKSVTGVAYKGVIDSLLGINLDAEILVLGFNHNLQSSFGVTNLVLSEIRNWIALNT